MIENERQYKITRAKLAELEQARADVLKSAEGYKPRIAKALRDSAESQIADLKREIAEYEDLCQRRTALLTMNSFIELGECLIKARLFRGYTQAELADRLSVHAQQIQRYEATKYESARFSRLVDIMDALEIDLRAVIDLDNKTQPSSGGTNKGAVAPIVDAPWLSPSRENYELELAGVGGDAARRAQGIITRHGFWNSI